LTAASDTCFHSLKYIREYSPPGHEPTGIACRGPCCGRTPPPIGLRRHRARRAPIQRRMVRFLNPTDPCDGIIGAAYTGSVNRGHSPAPAGRVVNRERCHALHDMTPQQPQINSTGPGSHTLRRPDHEGKWPFSAAHSGNLEVSINLMRESG